jgi:Heterokaryon incompatibility protein (HET)
MFEAPWKFSSATMNSGFALPPYVYEPLKSVDHVRVLVLRPTTAFNNALKTDIIQYNRRGMHLTSYTTTPVYEAVSYAWGNPDFTHHITCNDTTKLSITQKVDTMLRYFRRAAKPRYLWIDAICLNQSDESEKVEQIARMERLLPLYHKFSHFSPKSLPL